MIEIELTRKRIAILLVAFSLLTVILGSGAVSLFKSYDWKSLADQADCYITPPAQGTDLSVQLTQLPQIATTDYAPEAAAQSKTTVFILLCDGQSFERREFVVYGGGTIPHEYTQGGYRVAVMTAEVTVPYPTSELSPEVMEGYPP